LRVGCGANDITPEIITVTKPPEISPTAPGGGQDPHEVVAPIMKKNNITTSQNVTVKSKRAVTPGI
jgi:hypothetical protein